MADKPLFMVAEMELICGASDWTASARMAACHAI
ncbi:hypothetical protein FHR32_007642 [Streptosporangium album]|uniref:Uncharacterized protein n=1 Tax=Streptosporangium album TaxID=47479 RepID=A0A7W7WD18_9ACTN|nr:hypothetical protein [Streptosporangium album]